MCISKLKYTITATATITTTIPIERPLRQDNLGKPVRER